MRQVRFCMIGCISLSIIEFLLRGNSSNFQNCILFYYLNIITLILCVIGICLSFKKGLKLIYYVHHIIILNMINQQFVVSDDFEINNLRGRLEMILTTFKFLCGTLFVIMVDVTYNKNSSNNPWLQLRSYVVNVFLYFSYVHRWFHGENDF